MHYLFMEYRDLELLEEKVNKYHRDGYKVIGFTTYWDGDNGHTWYVVILEKMS